MGSWTELDAIYPPGTLTPASTLVAALGYLSGATSAYIDAGAPTPAGFLAGSELSVLLSHDVLERADRYLREVPAELFLAEAGTLLSRDQKLRLLLNLLDAVLGSGRRPDEVLFLNQAVEALGISWHELQPYQRVLMIKNDLSFFPQ